MPTSIKDIRFLAGCDVAIRSSTQPAAGCASASHFPPTPASEDAGKWGGQHSNVATSAWLRYCICPGGLVSSLESEVFVANSGLQTLDLAAHGS